MMNYVEITTWMDEARALFDAFTIIDPVAGVTAPAEAVLRACHTQVSMVESAIESGLRDLHQEKQS